MNHLITSPMPDPFIPSPLVEDNMADTALLARTQEQLALAVETAKLGVFEWYLTTGKVTWSFHHAPLFGLRPDEFNGTFEAFEGFIHPHDRAAFKATIKQAVATHEDFHHEYRVIWPDGSEHWIESRGKVFDDGQGIPIRLMGTVMDISQRKAAEEIESNREKASVRLSQAKLTPREMTLLKLIANGFANKRIAYDLKISVRTVAKHRSHLMAKTKALNAADLARITAIAGLAPAR